MGVEGAVGPCTNSTLRSFLSLLWSSFLSSPSFSESILPSGLRIYDVISFLLPLEVSSSPPGPESPLVVGNLCAGVTWYSPCVQDGACLCRPRWTSGAEKAWSVRSGLESEFVPFAHTAHESAVACDVEVQAQAAFSCTECDLKKSFCGPSGRKQVCIRCLHKRIIYPFSSSVG